MWIAVRNGQHPPYSSITVRVNHIELLPDDKPSLPGWQQQIVVVAYLCVRTVGMMVVVGGRERKAKIGLHVSPHVMVVIGGASLLWR